MRSLIGQSAAMKRVQERIRRVARSPVPVLVLGETGTGKELCAEAIASQSGRSRFIPVNCAAFTEGLIDSELFGHERGAFTGAHRSHSGLIAEADGGILFLDELAEVSPTIQAKLLRTLESGEYRPVGSTRVLRSRFRIIAATSGDLDGLVEADKLRADLLHRLGALRIVLPPLRERREDLPLLAHEFLRRYQERSPEAPSSISPRAMRFLAGQAWPGNVRQLRNIIEAAAAFAGSNNEIRIDHVIDVLTSSAPVASPADTVPTLEQVLYQAEERALLEALRRARGNRKRASRLLAIGESSLYRKLAKHFPGSERTDESKSRQ